MSTANAVGNGVIEAFASSLGGGLSKCFVALAANAGKNGVIEASASSVHGA